LNKVTWSSLSTGQKLRVLRTYELALARGREAIAGVRSDLAQRMQRHFTDADGLVNRDFPACSASWATPR